MAGERIVITIDGVPAAQLGPLNSGEHAMSIADLIAAGLVEAPKTASAPPPPRPVTPPPGRSSTDILDDHRSR